MIVCQCFGMSESDVKRVLRQLPDPANATVEVVIRTSGAGSDCTKCVPQIQALIEEFAAGEASSKTNGDWA